MLTRSGLGVLVTALVLLSLGLVWHYEELVLIAVASVVAVAIALRTARVPHRAVVTRRITAPRVARGDQIRLTYLVRNEQGRRSVAAQIIDRCDLAEIATPLVPVGPDERLELRAVIPTHRRGVFDVGPLAIQRADPLGLAIGRRVDPHLGAIIVHPRIYPLQGPYGAMHTVENDAVARRAASDPLSGFVSLREYVIGDDPRLIHWPTSARVGSLMVREHVELRKPEFTVVLDTAATVATEADFEEMVDVAASVAVHAVRSGVGVRLRTTSRAHAGSRHPIDAEARVLDFLTPIRQESPEGLVSIAELFAGGLDHTSIVMVTGPHGPSTQLTHGDSMSIVRVGDGAEPVVGISLAVTDAGEFARRWRPA